jgi:hypothetical protein
VSALVTVGMHGMHARKEQPADACLCHRQETSCCVPEVSFTVTAVTLVQRTASRPWPQCMLRIMFTFLQQSVHVCNRLHRSTGDTLFCPLTADKFCAGWCVQRQWRGP